MRSSVLAVLLVATAGQPEQPLSPWHYGTDCFVPAPDIFATRNFDAYGGAANDLACFRLNQTLMHCAEGCRGARPEARAER
jgi:hypothetical protein